MKLVPLNALFDIEYGSQLDLNKMELDPCGINFVSRSSRGLGVVAKVKKDAQAKVYEKGVITVTLGGTYLLSSFIQPEPFYTAQNIKVLTPKKAMTFAEKHYYTLCISHNRFKYSSHGREANTSLDALPVPDVQDIPDWVRGIGVQNLEIDTSAKNDESVYIESSKSGWFVYSKLFDIERGRGARKTDIEDGGRTPLITSIDKNNGVIGFVNCSPAHKGNVLTVNRNGSVGEAFYQAEPFCSTEDVHVFTPKFKMNIYHAMYLIPLIKKEAFRYTYGRKWGLSRMNMSVIRLPIDANNDPNWTLVERFIKSLPFSKALIGPQVPVTI